MMHNIIRYSIILVVAMGLVGCGQKGALYLPPDLPASANHGTVKTDTIKPLNLN